jgi:hypothetical protein
VPSKGIRSQDRSIHQQLRLKVRPRRPLPVSGAARRRIRRYPNGRFYPTRPIMLLAFA